ncbi:hypothetical protein [Kocuria tytonis]|uniref:Uncharacterized protein n=1 Tax=Kocuria tytonis TaxID=2054280 RepID=A0A495A857_9MICC|nr:hypothetical protein [Kocuria tytonis]RKQ36117.1 hypothetical protein C1C97_000025 [Kocuria tytonis]
MSEDPGGSAPRPPRTGLDAVDRVLARASGIARLPVTERAAAYDSLHGELERILAADPASLPTGLSGPPGSNESVPVPGGGRGGADDVPRTTGGVSHTGGASHTGGDAPDPAEGPEGGSAAARPSACGDDAASCR